MKRGLLIAVFGLAACSSVSEAVTFHFWNVSSGDWSISSNWSGGEPTSASAVYISNDGKAIITQPNEACYFCRLGQSGQSGAIEMTSGGLTAVDEYIGDYDKGTFTQTGGTNTVSNHLYIGRVQGTYDLGPTASLIARDESVGCGASGVFNQTGGTHSVAAFLDIATDTNSNGTYNLSDGQLVTSRLIVGNQGAGTFRQTGGTHTVQTTTCLLGNYAGSHGTYDLEGGTLILKSLYRDAGAATFHFGGGTLQAGGTFSTTLPITLTGTGGDAVLDTAGYAVTFSGGLSGQGGLTKRGANTLTLGGTNTYTGKTTVHAGVLALASSGSLLLDINSGSASSAILGNGAVNLNGALVFDMTDASAAGRWSVLAVDTLTEAYGGSFGVRLAVGSNMFAATEVSPGVWQCDAAGLPTVVFTESTGVLSMAPEPGSLSALVTGLLGLVACARRKTRLSPSVSPSRCPTNPR